MTPAYAVTLPEVLVLFIGRLIPLVLLLAVVGQAHAACPEYSSEPNLLMDLEAEASKGALTQDQKDCLEKHYGAAAEQTTKDKISRVLLVNAYAYSTKYWAKLVERHLDEVDRSDPDIAYLYAFYLFNSEPGRAEEAIRWTEVALERRDVWTGNVFVSRVYGLMKLRAVAANAAWQAAEERRSRGEALTDGDLDDLRNKTKTFAREWVDFAKVAGRDVTEAASLCRATASDRACGLDE